MNRFDLPADPRVAKEMIVSETVLRQQEIEAGQLGKFFGNNERVPIYIAGFVLFVVTLAGFVYTFVPDSWKTLPTVEMWKFASPIITACLAYIFGATGRGRSKKDE